MRLTVLVDNNTLTDRYLLGEAGLSFLLRDGGSRVLFDCGFSDVVCANAARMGIDLGAADVVALSHGHLDHTWGLAHLVTHFTVRALEGRTPGRPLLVAHPEAFATRRLNGMNIGSMVSEATLGDHFTFRLTREPLRLTDWLFFLGEIPRQFPFEATPPMGVRLTPAGAVPDTLPDDTALAYLGEDGLVIVTGCSHAGICNIVAHAREVTGESRVAAIVGGLHLLDASEDRIMAVTDWLADAGVSALYPCHCTGFAATMALAARLPVHEVGVGLALSFD
ncbi:MBL fold metallo-hydrolase [Solidesulfovibrio sp.]|uniref:MBL fold metallo-hydrolase n=1 Tax=Solidesulfovibrio sp. TaxID=2910990 RepID=UPI002B1FDE62|nr:MBL fold metallo-hydrolase [Solidesulfovibrio sp.]MEA5090401.1 MBL fold metallo-hydrolase [Solidesulfovibrio sp.]